jgi:hypothetical protein
VDYLQPLRIQVEHFSAAGTVNWLGDLPLPKTPEAAILASQSHPEFGECRLDICREGVECTTRVSREERL